ncbi:MAG: histidinol-phosphatase HisJ [Candidatus Omnitrophica bacterium]|nr:histidinol-phosphatase HisJ [Candidatus Omnitrophota bacterium]
MHTPLCGHASGAPEEYVQHAIAVGLKEIGFSDHAPLLAYQDPGIAMDIAQLPLYHQMIETMRAKYADQITVRVGVEADFLPGFEDGTRQMLAAYPYDYVIGSVHFIAKWGFDDPIQLTEWDQKDVNEVYREYFKLVRQSALTGLFDILGHIDLVKKFNFHPTEDMTDEIQANAEAFRTARVVIEINSSGLHKPAGEIYPALDHLKVYRAHGVPITFGSDAHKPVQVGRDFAKARDWALAAGYSEYVMFEKRRIVRTVKL